MQRRSDLSVNRKALALCGDGVEGREGVEGQKWGHLRGGNCCDLGGE